MEKLAIMGGTPVREKAISYGKQCIEEDDIQAVVEAMTADSLTGGPGIHKLEEKLCGSRDLP